MKQVEMHFVVAGSYWVPLDESAMDGYGTLDPQGMARVDQEVLEDDPGSFMHLATGWSVIPGKVMDKEKP